MKCGVNKKSIAQGIALWILLFFNGIFPADFSGARQPEC
jgi:hypothetical protein